MKKLIFILILSMSCYYQNEKIGNIYNYEFENNIPNSFESIEKAIFYTYQNSSYKSDIDIWGKKEYFQTPEQTYQMKTGDCEDLTLLSIYILETRLNLQCELILIKKKLYHTIIYIIDTDQYYDGTTYQEMEIENYIVNRYSYSQSLWMSIYPHRIIF